jgi:hypothetical protein
MALIINPTYFIDVVSLKALYDTDKIQIEAHGNYVKQTYRNRCYIAAANGKLALNIPIIHTGAGHSVSYDQIRIDHQQSWASNHLKSIKSAYNSSPFYEYYEDDLKTLFADIPDSLMQWNLKTLEFTISQLGIQKDILFTDEFENDSIAERLATAKAQPLYDIPRYIQVFQEKHGFMPALSSLDLLFNLGPEAIAYLANLNT